MTTTTLDRAVDHPAHYQSTGAHGGAGNIELFDVMEHYGLVDHAYLWNVCKYLARAHRKGALIVDLNKALVYLDRHLDTFGAECEPWGSADKEWPHAVDDIVQAFGLAADGEMGAHGQAFCALLDLCEFHDGREEGPEDPLDPDTGELYPRLVILRRLIVEAIAEAQAAEAAP